MKDEKTNFNSKLNDDALESVAGGKSSDRWTKKQKKFIETYDDGRFAGLASKFCGPKSFTNAICYNELLDELEIGKIKTELEKAK